MPCPSHLPSRTCPRCSLAYQQTSSTQRTVLTPPAPAYSAHPHSCTPNRVCACTSCAITTTAQYSVRAAYGSPNSSALRCRSYLSGTTSRVPSCSSSPASQNALVVLRSSRPTHRRLLGARIFFFFDAGIGILLPLPSRWPQTLPQVLCRPRLRRQKMARRVSHCGLDLLWDRHCAASCFPWARSGNLRGGVGTRELKSRMLVFLLSLFFGCFL